LGNIFKKKLIWSPLGQQPPKVNFKAEFVQLSFHFFSPIGGSIHHRSGAENGPIDEKIHSVTPSKRNLAITGPPLCRAATFNSPFFMNFSQN
jgi:hypothetical protein